MGHQGGRVKALEVSADDCDGNCFDGSFFAVTYLQTCPDAT